MIQVHLIVGSRYAVNRTLLRQTVERVLHDHRITHAQVALSVVGNRKIKTLNENQLHHTGITDVLSFPQNNSLKEASFPTPDGMPPHLGDIVISFPVAVAAAKRYGKRVDEQLCFFAEHGLMHLLGYHHD